MDHGVRYGNSGWQVSKAGVQNEMYFGPISELDKQNAIFSLKSVRVKNT